ncbi:MAG TPA: ABC transporter substrate-binding protein [Bradyrhizobium sp.]|nr:ABC transporter substrate-binding protein [Bradyrhizobium sp.]
MNDKDGTRSLGSAGATRNGDLTRRKLIKASGATVAATALFSGFPAPRVRAAKPAKVGYVTPQTGPLAPFAEADNFIVGSVREVFKKHDLPIEIIVKDSQTNSNRAAEVAADLILKDKVSLMVVGAAPETDNPVADQCELNEVPCVSTVSPWQPWFFARGGKPDKPFKWTYHYFWGLEDAIGIILDMWSQPQLQTNRVVGAVFANDPDGNAWGDAERGLPPALAKSGYKLIHPPHFQTLTDNFSAQISAFKEAGAEIITGNMIPPDFTTFWTQARQQGLRPKVCTITKALLFPSSVESVGQTANNLSTEVWWTPTSPFKSSLTGQSAAELASAYTQATGKQWTQPIGFVHSLFEIAADILKRSGDTQDASANLDALLKTDLQTIVGPISWGKGPVKNVAKTPLVSGQWRVAAGGPFKYDLIVVANGLAPQIPLGGKMELLA